MPFKSRAGHERIMSPHQMFICFTCDVNSYYLISNPGMNFSTPKAQNRHLKNVRKSHSCIETPDYFNKVIMETPNKKPKNRREKFDEISNLVVAVRIRPMNCFEGKAPGAESIVKVKNQELILSSEKNTGTLTDYVFQYDHIFWSIDESNILYSTQEDVFLTIGLPLLNNAFKGFNACLFAYGQTGSGKSYSMMGKSMCEIEDIESDKYSGIIPRFCRELFQRISDLGQENNASVEVSYYEIYNEKIHDLLSSTSTNERTCLKVREHPEWGPYVVDLSTHIVKSYEELRSYLIKGNRSRATAATMLNDKSSRSHSICSIELCMSESLNETDNSRRSKVSLVDLAGSERLGYTNISDDQMKQGVYINKSLLTLGKVISTLADQRKNQFVPYRESVLTWLLKESLGGNSLTSMLATITPSSTHIEETLATLRYACQARSIVNRARINESPHDRLIRELRTEVQRLKDLRQDFEHNSTFSAVEFDDSSSRELEEVRKKLMETENRLLEAQNEWQQRFKETNQRQLEELAHAEKAKAELESKFRVLQTIDDNVNLSPYKSNFLKDLEGVLTESEKLSEDNLFNIKNWCATNNLVCTEGLDCLQIYDYSKKRQSVVSKTHSNFNHVSDFINSLKWSEIKNIEFKLTKSEVVSSMNKIYELLATLKPSENENGLSLLFAKVNKSLQSFETALLNNAKNNSKTVTFDI